MIPSQAPETRQEMDALHKQISDTLKDIERSRKIEIQSAWPVVQAANAKARDARRAFIASWNGLVAQFLSRAARFYDTHITVVDETQVPDEFCTLVRVVDKDRVKTAIEAGQVVPGVTVERRPVSPWKEFKE